MAKAADLTKPLVQKAVLNRFPEVGQKRDIAISGPQVLAEVVFRTNSSVTFRIVGEHGMPRYFEVKVTEKL